MKKIRTLFPLWWRFFFLRFFLLVTALVVIAYGLFVFIDLVEHGKEFFDKGTPFKIWRTYYLSMFIYRLDTLIPFAIATATAITIPKLVINNELLPLLNAGVSLRNIIRPFLAVTAVAGALLWLNYEFAYPRAIVHYRRCSSSDFGKKEIKEDPSRLGVVLFKEGSRLFFNSHNPSTKTLSDVFWVRSSNCVLHIEKLNYFLNRQPEGYGVDVIERQQSGDMQKTATYPFCELPELNFTRNTLRLATADPKELSPLQLASLVSGFGKCTSQRTCETIIALWQKILIPFLALFAFAMPLPLCLRFEKRYPQALLVFTSLISLFLFLLITQAFSIFARIPFVPPTPVILAPYIAMFAYIYRGQKARF
jgi:lipopolysaccharide export LptBFGC system permease protein LptF